MRRREMVLVVAIGVMGLGVWRTSVYRVAHRPSIPHAEQPIPIAADQVAAPEPIRRYWKDPSIDPAVLERAYAPAQVEVPPVNTPRLTPPHAEWRKLRYHEHDAVAN